MWKCDPQGMNKTHKTLSCIVNCPQLKTEPIQNFIPTQPKNPGAPSTSPQFCSTPPSWNPMLLPWMAKVSRRWSIPSMKTRSSIQSQTGETSKRKNTLPISPIEHNFSSHVQNLGFHLSPLTARSGLSRSHPFTNNRNYYREVSTKERAEGGHEGVTRIGRSRCNNAGGPSLSVGNGVLPTCQRGEGK